MKKWKTSIAGHKDGDLYIRGEKLVDLIGEMSFSEAIYFVLRGEKPTAAEVKLLDAILVMAINHGLEAPSSYVPRVAASVGNQINTALATGVLMVGDFHGGAVEGAMKNFYLNSSAKEIVETVIARGERMPGYGHKIYKDSDPRVVKIQSLAGQSKYFKLALEIREELEQEIGKKLPLNIDGAMAAILCELGFDPIQGKAFFALARFPSMMANIEEELKNEKPYRRLSEEDVDYTGQ